jgi:hypothetical protein
MRSLFAKMLASFLLTVMISTVAGFYIWNTFERRQTPQTPGIGRSFELREARQAWETGGPAGLEAFFIRWKEAMSTVGAEAVLTDGSGPVPRSRSRPGHG